MINIRIIYQKASNILHSIMKLMSFLSLCTDSQCLCPVGCWKPTSEKGELEKPEVFSPRAVKVRNFP